MRRLLNQDGALSPAFLLFVVTAAAASLFLVQYAHAHVLRTEAHTAAEAAALAAGREQLRQMLIGLAAYPAPPPPINPVPMQARAQDYASNNNAQLTNFSRTGECSVRTTVRGNDRVATGPSNQLRNTNPPRPESVAAAEVQLPPLAAMGLSLSCTGLLSVTDDGLLGGFLGLPVPSNPPFADPEPLEEDYDDPDDWLAAHNAWQTAKNAHDAANVAANDVWNEAIRNLTSNLLSNDGSVRLVAPD